MKYIVDKIFGLLIIFSSLNAQSGLMYEYYPMQKGNVYQYKQTDIKRINGIIVNYELFLLKVSVLGDTVLLDGKHFQIIENRKKNQKSETVSYNYQRIDTTKYQVFGYYASQPAREYLIDSLQADSGAIFKGAPLPQIGWTKVMSIDSQYYFGMKTIRRMYAGGFPEFDYYVQDLQKGIGITTRTYGTPGMDMYPGNSTVDTLVYAKINGKEYGSLLKVIQDKQSPNLIELSQNFPNPFNPSTTITYSIPERSNVRLSVFNTLGQKISEIVNETKDAGSYEHSFNALQLSSGIYFYRIEATSTQNSGKTFVETKKMVLLR